MTCGFLVLDKPSGMTSRRAVDRVKGLVRPEKTGHCGTLDPLATGVLVVAVGKATRLVSSVHDQRKTYRATFLLGRRSDSDDTETEVEVYEETPVLDEPTIEAALREFLGPISQVPPAYSAVKVGGRRAYKLARAGQELDLKPRTVEIDSIQLLDWDSPRLELEIVCSGGTYIRSLGRDLGPTVSDHSWLLWCVENAAAYSILPIGGETSDLPADTSAHSLWGGSTCLWG